MRPEALELESFTAFRERTRVDFGDAELLALTGPTGAGKSSLIDAMIFALYGSVPRLGQTLVEPVISKGKQEARVRLDFTLGGRRYTAVRVVRRTSSDGATTKEARLECGEDVLAANVKDLNERVRTLIGLDFEQFTTCVVLPQGEFARFLKQTPAERQKLLSQLLGLDIYKLVRSMARDVQNGAEAEISLLSSRLNALAYVTKAVVQAAKKRRAALKTLQTLAAEQLGELAKLRKEAVDTKTQHEATKAQIKALDEVRTPEAVTRLAEAIVVAEKQRTKAQEELDNAERHVERTKTHHDSLGDVVALNLWRTHYAKRSGLVSALVEAEQAVEVSAEVAAEQEAALGEARTAVRTAQVILDNAKRIHTAYALREHLTVGEPCPVCEREVAQLPLGGRPAALGESEQTLKNAEDQLAHAEDRNMECGKAHSRRTAQWQSKQGDLEELDALLRDAPALPEVERRITDIAVAAERIRVAERELADAKKAASQAVTAVSEAQTREGKAWKGYHEARDGLAVLSPPKPDTRLVQAWTALAAWARTQVPKLQQKRTTLAKRVEDLEGTINTLDAGLTNAFGEHHVAYDDDAEINLATAASKAESELDDLRKKFEEKRDCKRQAKTAQRRADVAQELAGHLVSDGFERWLLAAAFDQLVSNASRVLQQLSSGQYTFHRNRKFEFDVVDHGNAGETRSAKTLSGGETFLASLALALALSEHTANLATKGTARLESIFLDEGFGALDGETLDTVATAIEDLSTRGRMVGVVTHVADLAERIPVRFKVSKTAVTARVDPITT